MHFDIKAYRAGEGVSELRLSAADAGEAERQAVALGYRVISSRGVHRLSGWSMRRAGRRFSLALFSQELLTLLEAGLI